MKYLKYQFNDYFILESDSEEQSDFEEKAKSKKKKPLPTKSKKENRKNSGKLHLCFTIYLLFL